ncbi:hypothetical protein CsSME_00001395 [Camellia sinensis var. sinensis]
MDGSEIIEARGLLGLPPPPSLIVAVAINGNRKSKYVVKWALEKFVPDGKSIFKLLHVRPNITAVPTPMGNFIPLSQVRDDIADAYRKEVEWQTNEKLLPYKKMCTQKKVQVEILQIESDDVVYAISNEITKSTINKLVIGTSSRGMFSRESCHLCAHLIWRQLEALKMTVVRQVALTMIRQVTVPAHKQVNVNFELEKLRIELRHIRGMYAIAQSETIDASRKVNDLQRQRLEETIKLKEINVKEVEAKEMAIQEKVKYEAVKREVEYVKECAEREAAQKKDAEINAFREAKEKEKLENVLLGPLQQYQKFEWEEIVSATSSFSDNLKIGMGGYGIVYKCSLHHTIAAVKVLHSKEAHRNKQFQQELEILSNIHHPHLLILLGACPDHGCLVYEYMENGSLEDRLLRKNNTPPIPWFDRYRIAWEIASALVFLHNSKPQPIIHRDLKPANILLDHNFVSKIGDVGLSKMLNSESSAISTLSKDTGPVGTLCYIDPEYQRTGLISQSSDVYAFGMVILQLLTAKPAIALAHTVELAVEDGHLADLLDIEAGQWPIEETKELAVLGLKCAELRRRDRPDLRDHVLPELERLKEFADRARDMASNAQLAPPNLFMCPILKDVMEDPCVAADGYTYDRKAIEIWLKEDDKSPMTNLPLPDKSLIPNYTLLSAIMEWKSGKQ